MFHTLILTYPEELSPLVLVELGRPLGAERQHEEGDPQHGVDKVEDGEEADDGEGDAVGLEPLVVLAEGGEHLHHLEHAASVGEAAGGGGRVVAAGGGRGRSPFVIAAATVRRSRGRRGGSAIFRTSSSFIILHMCT